MEIKPKDIVKTASLNRMMRLDGLKAIGERIARKVTGKATVDLSFNYLGTEAYKNQVLEAEHRISQAMAWAMTRPNSYIR
ncbi:MAG: hypothetical protein NWE76_05885 [Candidatus Bathyarchaeota archaeon]|nr:hypothetical protein [Candidatus Bathyarchaeota archaeon]